MVYNLYHKDIPVLCFKMEDDEITNVLDIYNERHLPIGVFKNFERDVSQKQQFKTWWKGRMIPASRQNLRDALESLGGISTEKLVAKSFGLSLSDQYWAKPINNDLSWKDVNFFQNDFSEDVGKALFGTLDIVDASSINLVSPDNTSDGWLKKKWIIDNGERILLKGGSGESQQEPFNEVFASEVFQRFEIPHVNYSIVHSDGKYYCACKDFITTETELISAWHIRNTLKKDNNISEYKHLIKCCVELGMKDTESIEKQLCKMFAVDCIVANSDRHMTNFGFIRNANSLEWLGLAPVYDTGTAMFYDVALPRLKANFDYFCSHGDSKPFAKTHFEQLKKLPCSKYCGDLPFEKLKNIETFFNELFSKNDLMLPEKKEILCSILKERVYETERFLKSPNINMRVRRNDSLWER